MARYDVVLLDADMTLLDFERSQREALGRTLRKWDLPDDDETQAAYAKINAALWDAMARGEVDQDFLVAERFAALLRVCGKEGQPRLLNRDYERFLGEEAYLLPGALEFCQTLSGAGLTLAIATNGLPEAQRGRYTRTGLDQYIPHLFISMELGASKPRPEFFQRALERLNVTDDSRVVMVGDSLGTDILGAGSAGLDSIWFNPQGKPLTGPAKPTWTAASYDQVLDILKVKKESGI
jgi:2-haloacid dehalogenase